MDKQAFLFSINDDNDIHYQIAAELSCKQEGKGSCYKEKN
ncbi:hypothetical protein SPX_37230 [Sporomusa paucivorans]